MLNISRNGADILKINKLIKKVRSLEPDKGENFIRTLDYFGINYSYSPEKGNYGLYLNQQISIYWRGDKKYYYGIVEYLNNVQINNKNDIEIVIKYSDGDKWKYLVSRLDKSSSEWSNHSSTNWVHYGVNLGSTKL